MHFCCWKVNGFDFNSCLRLKVCHVHLTPLMGATLYFTLFFSLYCWFVCLIDAWSFLQAWISLWAVCVVVPYDWNSEWISVCKFHLKFVLFLICFILSFLPPVFCFSSAIDAQHCTLFSKQFPCSNTFLYLFALFFPSQIISLEIRDAALENRHSTLSIGQQLT